MPVWSVVSDSSTSPASTSNRTRSQAQVEMCYYVGGDDDSDQKTRAGTCWDRAVRDFNSVLWKFNRQHQDYTLPTDFNSDGEADLPANFRGAVRMMLLNSDGESVDQIEYKDWRIWTITDPAQFTSGAMGPNYYTSRNPHSDLTFIIDPIPDQTSTYTYPTLRLFYAQRIEIAAADDETLDVPVEVDEAIFALALAKFIKMNKGARESAEYERDATVKRMEVEQAWRDHEDFEIC